MTIDVDNSRRLRQLLREAARKLSQVVYFIQAQHEMKLVKIGTAIDVKLRLSSLQCGSPVPLKLLVAVPGDASLESELHERFRDLRMHGEWFSPGDALRAYIRDCRREDTRNRLMYERRVQVSRVMATIRRCYSERCNAMVEPVEGELRA